MAKRSLVGQLPGGLGNVPDPSMPFKFSDRHAPGRLRSEAQKFINAVFLKSTGKLGNNPSLTTSGAAYQDYTGSKQYHRCHRSVYEPIINGSTMPRFARSQNLWLLLVTPLAITDPEPAPANYGDLLHEIVSEEPLKMIMWATLQKQRADKPLEINMLHDVISGQLPLTLYRGYDAAMAKANEKERERGWVEHRGPIPTQVSVRIVNAHGQPITRDPKLSAEAQVNINELRSLGPAHLLDEDRLEEIAFSIYQAGWSRYQGLAENYLNHSREIMRHTPPPFMAEDSIKEAVAQLEEASKIPSPV